LSETRHKPKNKYRVVIIHSGSTKFEREDVITLINELDKIDTKKDDTLIEVLLNSRGGDIYAAYKMVHLLRSKCIYLRFIIPLYAKSAATLMALGGNEIIMGQQSELGPLDAPMEHPLVEGIRLSALDGVRPLELISDFCKTLAIEGLGVKIRSAVGLGRKDSVDIALRFACEFVKPVVGKLDPLVFNMCYRRLQIAEKYGRELLESYMFKDEQNKADLAHKTITQLVWMYPEHGYAISSEEAKRLKLKITDAENFDEWDQYWKLYNKIKDKGEKSIALIPEELITQLGSNTENENNDEQ